VTYTLNHHRPTGSTPFALSEQQTEDAISRSIVWSIFKYSLPPVVLVRGDDHWIVVHGFDTTANPSSSNDPTYTIRAFDVRDPEPPANENDVPPVPPHAAADGCGSGWLRGQAPQHMTYVEWRDNYMTGVPAGHWQGMFLAVCNGAPPPRLLRRVPIVKRPRRKPSRGGKTFSSIIRPDQARGAAVDGLTAYGLYERREWQAILSDTTAGAPRLVQRLDRLNSFYYLVPLLKPDKRMTATAIVDAVEGDYRQVAARPDATDDGRFTIAGDAVLAMCVNRQFELPDYAGNILVREEAAGLHPALVWRPCVESLSPYLPFFMVTIGDHRLYVRLDGRIFTALHDAGPGF
jgi:hypothetical protein